MNLYGLTERLRGDANDSNLSARARGHCAGHKRWYKDKQRILVTERY